MRFRSHLSRPLVAASLVVATVAAVTMSPQATPVAHAGDVKLFVVHRVKSDCVVYPNYPKPGVKGQVFAWTIAAGKSVIWRYNVNETWALVSDPGRAKSKFPWWGFMERSCIGKSIEQHDYPEGVDVPDRIREGRSRVAKSGWRPVDYDQGPETIVKSAVRVKKNGTLRDRVNFVVGNVFAGWRVDVTNVTRSKGHWVYVYSPSARKWGYIERDKLDL